MKTARDVVLLICGDPDASRRFLNALRSRPEVSVPLAASLAQARAHLRRADPSVILLDRSALRSRPLEPAVRELARVASVIVCALDDDPTERCHLEDLIVGGKVEFLIGGRDLADLAAGEVERRLRSRRAWASLEGSFSPGGGAIAGDFGEILRHEINNPLTGILGNAELLLARRESLPETAIHRLETIAELAVRLRETIRRLSNTLEARTAHARSA